MRKRAVARRSRTMAGPGVVVCSAYLAANRGRFTEANRYVAPPIVRSLRKSQASLRSSRIRMRATLPKVSSASQRKRLRRILADLSMFLDPNFCWRMTTRGGSISSVKVIREVIRGTQAQVTVALRLKSGGVVKQKEKLTRTRRGWLIGERAAPQNKELKLTKPGKRRSFAA
jgi:hypothetical protein